MWCSLCRTDVSARTTGHAGGLLCARCGHDLLSETKPNDAIRQAREILERWNSSDLFERISRTESLDAFHTRMDAVKKSSAPPQLLRGDLLESASSKKLRELKLLMKNTSVPEASSNPNRSIDPLNLLRLKHSKKHGLVSRWLIRTRTSMLGRSWSARWVLTQVLWLRSRKQRLLRSH